MFVLLSLETVQPGEQLALTVIHKRSFSLANIVNIINSSINSCILSKQAQNVLFYCLTGKESILFIFIRDHD